MSEPDPPPHFTDEQLNASLDKAMLATFGRTYRPGEIPPKTKSDASSNGDQFGQPDPFALIQRLLAED